MACLYDSGLSEPRDGIQEVVGSIPISSTATQTLAGLDRQGFLALVSRSPPGSPWDNRAGLLALAPESIREGAGGLSGGRVAGWLRPEFPLTDMAAGRPVG
jgi:hypothetical protein